MQIARVRLVLVALAVLLLLNVGDAGASLSGVGLDDQDPTYVFGSDVLPKKPAPVARVVRLTPSRKRVPEADHVVPIMPEARPSFPTWPAPLIAPRQRRGEDIAGCGPRRRRALFIGGHGLHGAG